MLEEKTVTTAPQYTITISSKPYGWDWGIEFLTGEWQIGTELTYEKAQTRVCRIINPHFEVIA